MPSTSEKQRKFFGAVLTAKKTGKGSPEALKAAKEMTLKQIEDYLVKESNVSKVLSILEGEFISEATVTIEKSQGEYRVPSEDGYEDGAYYDNDKESAIAVAKKTFGDDVVIKFRSVPEFVGGKYEKMRPKK